MEEFDISIAFIELYLYRFLFENSFLSTSLHLQFFLNLYMLTSIISSTKN